MKGSSLPGTLRLRARDGKGGAKPFEQIGKTNDEGQFDFKDLPAGHYETRLTPVGMSEVSVPVLVDLRHSTTRRCLREAHRFEAGFSA